MRKHSTFRDRRGDERGVALVLTLSILALVTLLLIAFVASMRVENAASKNFNEVIKARELAQGGVDEALGTIRMFTPPVTPTGNGLNGTNYVTAPGFIYAYSSKFTVPGWTNVALFTPDPANLNGTVPTASNMLITNEVNLNTNWVITGSGTVYNANASPPNSGIWVGWSNVTATVNGASQLVGRYAYWVDDESAKVDVNVASTRGNDLEGYTPAAIDLGGAQPQEGLDFTLAEVGSLTNYVQSTRPLDTIEGMTMLSPPLPSSPSGANAPGVSTNTFLNSRFYVTTYSTSPDITPWGDKRLNLSNVIANASSKSAAAINIANWLTAEDGTLSTWFNGKSFTAKYPSLQQIAANIVDYITTDNLPTDSGNFNDTTAPVFLGLKETPYLNELVISNAFTLVNQGSGTYQLTITSYPLVELWYMYGNTAGWTVPNKPQVTLISSANPLSMSIGAGFTPNTASISGSYSIKNGFSAMGPNSYLVVPPTVGTPILTTTASITLGANPLPATIPVTLNPGTITAIFTSQGVGNAGRMDYAVIGFPTVIKVNVPTTPGSQVSALWSAQCNDPRVKPISNTWKQNLGTPTLGQPNSSPTFNLSGGSGTLTGDGDMSCHTNNSVNIPNTSGFGRQRGSMTPGELAFIHTGVPWRTFSLQPWPPVANPSDPGPPDWALLDLLSATDATDVVGRININQAIGAVSAPGRALPMAALLTNFLQNSNYSLANATNNLYSYYLDTTGYRFSTAAQLGPNFCPSAYTMIGEIANTQSLSNFGTAPSPSKYVLETPVRDIVNLITTRSDTFTIWCLGQSVKKVDKTNPTTFVNGTDIVTGEAKVQAIVERTVDTSAGLPGQVKFRTLYYRYYYQ